MDGGGVCGPWGLVLLGDAFEQQLARDICRHGCPVRASCLAELQLIERKGNHRFGVRAGFTAAERMEWD